jgi:hypothetical protein
MEVGVFVFQASRAVAPDRVPFSGPSQQLVEIDRLIGLADQTRAVATVTAHAFVACTGDRVLPLQLFPVFIPHLLSFDLPVSRTGIQSICCSSIPTSG